MWACVRPLLCYAVLSVLSRFAIIVLGMRAGCFYFYCLFNGMCLNSFFIFLTVLWVGLQYVIETYPGHLYHARCFIYTGFK